MAIIGKLAQITDRTSEYFGVCGIVRGFDGEKYYIRINYKNMEFAREQFEVPGCRK